MTTIELYKPGSKAAVIRWPTTWNELTLKQLDTIANGLQQDVSRPALFIQLLEIIALEQHVKLPRGWKTLLDFEQAAIDGLPLVDLLLEENNLTKNPLPYIKKHHGPADAFDDLTCGEYEDAEIFYLQFCEDRNLQHLRDLAAVLWRPAPDKKHRMPYTGDVEKSSFSKKLSASSLHHIFLWYSGCRLEMIKLFPEVFKQGEGSSSPEINGFTRLIHAGAGAKNGSRLQIRAMLIKEFLFDCQLTAEQNLELEENLRHGTK